MTTVIVAFLIPWVLLCDNTGMSKTPQQRYLEKIVKHVPCACGCGGVVAVKRYATMPSYLRKRKHKGRFLPGHNVVFDKRKRDAGNTWPCGEDARRWKGGRYKLAAGYVSVSVPGRGHIFEHRVIMEEHVGRRLRSNEVVHHINGVKDDNRLENLELMSAAAHTRRHKKVYRKMRRVR